MILFKKADALQNYLDKQRTIGVSVGFVPTMGALHEGHLSLIDASRKSAGQTVCSIFVNPTQFNNAQDFDRYPITIDLDIDLLVKSQCDVLFLPGKEEIYPAHYQAPHYELGFLEQTLEGHFRPGHFQGVCQVVDRLLQIVNPNVLYMGAKDFQQCKVVQRLLSLTNKKDATRLEILPTIREVDGLAMSSRNRRLNHEQRQKAVQLFRNLSVVKEKYLQNFSATQLEDEAASALMQAGFKVDYFEIRNLSTLEPATGKSEKVIALVAAYLEEVRLIDNLELN